MPVVEKKVLVLSEIEEPKFKVKLTTDGEEISFDPFEVIRNIEQSMIDTEKERGAKSDALTKAVRTAFKLPSLGPNACQVLWGSVNDFVRELDSTKKLLELAGQNSSNLDANSVK